MNLLKRNLVYVRLHGKHAIADVKEIDIFKSCFHGKTNFYNIRDIINVKNGLYIK